MNFYEEPYYCEPSEFDEKCEELIEMLRKNANEHIKAELEALRKENAKMKDIVNNYNQKVKELEQAKRKYEVNERNLRNEIKNEVKQLRLSELLEGFQTTIYKVYNIGKEKPKCDKCDENRRLCFTSPRGKQYSEPCECSEKLNFYIAKDCKCSEFKINHFYGKRYGQLVGWYKLNLLGNGEEYYTPSEYTAEKMYNGQAFVDLDVNDTYFYDETTAQQYADWLNNKESEKNE